MDYYGYGWHSWGWLGPIVFGLLLMLVIFTAMKFLFNRSAPPNGSASITSATAVSVLEERYARGEIDRDEFLQKRDDLQRP